MYITPEQAKYGAGIEIDDTDIVSVSGQTAYGAGNEVIAELNMNWQFLQRRQGRRMVIVILPTPEKEARDRLAEIAAKDEAQRQDQIESATPTVP